jgi:hypothetical protein
LKLDEQSSYQLVPDSRLKDAWSVYLCTGDVNHQYTVHHPLGINPLGKDSWVLSKPGQVHEMLRNLSHPDEVRVGAARREFIMSSCVEAGLLTRVRDQLYYPNDPVKARSEHIAEARKALAEAKSEKGSDYLTRMAPEVIKQETMVREFLSSPLSKKAAEGAFPLPAFETCSGATGTEQQHLSWLKGKTSYESAKLLRQVLENTAEQNFTLFTGLVDKGRTLQVLPLSGTSSPSLGPIVLGSKVESPSSSKKKVK